MTEIREVFDSIHEKYDLLDTLISFGRDQRWRRRCIDLIEGLDCKVALDNGSGTGKLAQMLRDRFPEARIYMLDLTASMMGLNRVQNAEKLIASADRVPLEDGSVDLITGAFLTRNVPYLHLYLKESYRLLRPGGIFLNLDIFMPSPPGSFLFKPYFFHIMPVFGNLVTGSKSYTYLADSVRKFVSSDGFTDLMKKTGFGWIKSEKHGLGAVWIHIGTKL